MNISATLFPAYFVYASGLLSIALLLLALQFIDWGMLKRNSQIQHVLGFCTVALMLAWMIRAGISDGLGIHLYLITALHLLLGWQLAIWVACFAMLGMIALGLESFEGFGINMLVSAVVPILSNYCVWRWHENQSFKSPFTFIFIVVFFGAMLAVVNAGIVMSVIMIWMDVYSLDRLVHEFWQYAPLIAFPEATINGIIITVLIVYCPEWVRLFDSAYYSRPS